MNEVGRHAVPRARTDELIGESIGELVERAAEREAERRGRAPLEPPPASQPAPAADRRPTGNGSDRLYQVLAEIEEAAANARLAAPAPARPTNGSGKTEHRQEPESIDDLPAIDVWKRQPEVRIYRRQPGPDGKDQLVEVKGKDHG
jgi:hypothetical protein